MFFEISSYFSILVIQWDVHPVFEIAHFISTQIILCCLKLHTFMIYAYSANPFRSRYQKICLFSTIPFFNHSPDCLVSNLFSCIDIAIHFKRYIFFVPFSKSIWWISVCFDDSANQFPHEELQQLLHISEITTQPILRQLFLLLDQMISLACLYHHDHCVLCCYSINLMSFYMTPIEKCNLITDEIQLCFKLFYHDTIYTKSDSFRSTRPPLLT